jgi:hypothetical protein
VSWFVVGPDHAPLTRFEQQNQIIEQGTMIEVERKQDVKMENVVILNTFFSRGNTTEICVWQRASQYVHHVSIGPIRIRYI